MGIKIKQTSPNRSEASSFDLEALLTREISVTGVSFGSKKKEQWYAELSLLLKSGIDLRSALELLAETQKKDKDKQLLTDLLEQLVEGNSFSTILENNKNFSRYEYYAIRIGEQTGQLGQIASELSDFFRYKNEQRREIISALTYPVIVLATALLVILFMMKYVIPMFVDIFKQNKVDLPPLTNAIVGFSDVITSYGWLLLLGSFGLGISVYFASRTLLFKQYASYLVLKLPILGAYFRKIYMAQFTQAIALLTTARVPVLESLDLVQHMIAFYPLQEGLKRARQEILSGGKMSTAFGQSSIFDLKMIAMVRVAEETNQTEFIFQKLNEQYNQQVKYQSQIISNVLNPILTLMVGIIVGIILIAMYLPMFRLSSLIG